MAARTCPQRCPAAGWSGWQAHHFGKESWAKLIIPPGQKKGSGAKRPSSMGRQSLSLGRRQSSRLAIEEIAINARQQRLLELKASAKDANKGATTNPQLLWSKFSKNGGIVWHWSLRRRHSIASCLDDCSVCAGLRAC